VHEGCDAAYSKYHAAVARSGKHHHSVYVVLLSKDVLFEPKFRRCNPGYDPEKPCVYVGMTGLDPDARFDKHKAGIRSNRFVRMYGLRLAPELYACFNPMPYEAARDMEVELAIGLREDGYAVWQG
jgi:hypothetical protein